MTLQGLIKAIKSLEQQYDVPLFIADENGVLVPTNYADELYGFAEKWDQNSIALEESFNRIRSLENHMIRLGSCLGIMGNLGSPFLEGFKRLNPDIAIQYGEHSDFSCDKGLLLGSYELALTMAPFDQSFITMEMFSDNFIFWINKKNPLSMKTEGLHLEDLRNQNIAIPGEGYKCYDTFIMRGNCEGINFGRIFQTAEMFQIFGYALYDHGIGMGIESLTDLEVFQKEEVVAIPYLDAKWRYGLSHLSAHTLTSIEQRFCEYCLDFSKRSQGSGIKPCLP